MGGDQDGDSAGHGRTAEWREGDAKGVGHGSGDCVVGIRGVEGFWQGFKRRDGHVNVGIRVVSIHQQQYSSGKLNYTVSIYRLTSQSVTASSQSRISCSLVPPK